MAKPAKSTKAIRRFTTGATRDRDTHKCDPEGAWSPLVWQRLARYIHDHRHLPDGTIRSADNWQRGMPPRSYLQSACRHLLAAWLMARGQASRIDWMALTGRPDAVPFDEALCGVLFNVMGLLHEYLIRSDRSWRAEETWPNWAEPRSRSSPNRRRRP